MRNSKSLLILLSAALPLAPGISSLAASPLISVGNSTDIFFNGSTTVNSSSNVFKNVNDESDIFVEFRPGLEVNIGRGASNADIRLVTDYTIRRYQDFDEQDTELFSVALDGSYDSGPLQLSGMAIFSEVKANTGDRTLGTADLVELETTSFSLGGEYQFSPKFSFGAGVNHDLLEFDAPYSAVLSDTETTRLPLNVFYELTPKVDLSAGFTFTTREVQAPSFPLFGVSTYDQESHFFNVGARGELLPKLTGSVRVGLRARDNDDRIVRATGQVIRGANDDSFGIDANLSYDLTPKVKGTISASRDFGAGSLGEAIESTRFGLGASYAINATYSASAAFNYEFKEYDTADDREDTGIGFNAGLIYRPNEYWMVVGQYVIDDSDSDLASRSYTEHLFSLSASLRY